MKEGLKEKTLTTFCFPSLVEFIDITIDSCVYDMNKINLGHIQMF